MLLNRNLKLQVIHIAKKQCGLDDEEYRLLLTGAAGISSASEMESELQFNNIMDAFGKLGFRRDNRPYQTKKRKHENHWGCTEKQRYYIEGLWKLMSRKKDLESLESMVKRIGHVDHPRFLNNKKASGIILAMRKMCIDQGINPDKKDF